MSISVLVRRAERLNKPQRIEGEVEVVYERKIIRFHIFSSSADYFRKIQPAQRRDVEVWLERTGPMLRTKTAQPATFELQAGSTYKVGGRIKSRDGHFLTLDVGFLLDVRMAYFKGESVGDGPARGPQDSIIGSLDWLELKVGDYLSLTGSMEGTFEDASPSTRIDGQVYLWGQDVAQLVANQLRHGSPWQNRDDVQNTDGISRVLREAGALRTRFVTAIMGLLIHPDISIRSQAIYLLSDIAADVGANALLEMIERYQVLFKGVAPEGVSLDHADLEAALLDAMAYGVQPGEQKALERLRGMASDPNEGWRYLPALASSDGEWLCDNAAGLVPFASSGGVLMKLGDNSLRERFIVAMQPWPDADRARLTTHPVWRGMPADEAQRLKDLMVQS